MKKVLSIAGSDCSGGAGIQADLKTFSAHGVFGMSVIVSVVPENTSRVIDIQDITPDMIGNRLTLYLKILRLMPLKLVCFPLQIVCGRLPQRCSNTSPGISL